MRVTAGFRPLQLVDVEITDLPPGVRAGTDPAGRPYERAQILFRRSGRPLGTSVMPFARRMISAEVLDILASQLLDAHGAPPTDGPLPTTGAPVTVLIATRNRPESLRRCLDSLARVAYAPFRVVVVDNVLSPGITREVVTQAAADGLDVSYVHEPIKGLSTAHNAGLRAVDTDLVAITDDDVEVDPAWLGAVAETFAVHPDAGAVTGLIYPARLDHPLQVRAEGAGFGKGFDVRRFHIDQNTRGRDPLFAYAVGRYGSGANMAFRRAALAEVGGFDLSLGAGSPGAGGDDLAVLHDLVVRGHAVVYQPAAIVRHHHSDEPGSLRRQAYGYGKGLGAYLTRCALTDPDGIAPLIRLVPAGLAHMSRSSGQATTLDNMRRGHRVRHLAGLVSGPAGYLAGRRRARRISHLVGGGLGRTAPSATPAGRP